MLNLKSDIPIQRVWAMPNKWTFKIKPIAELLSDYCGGGGLWCDPFAGRYSPAEVCNDLNPDLDVEYNMDALDFLKLQEDEKFDGVLLDPPYSLRQLKECYDNMGMALSVHQTRHFFSDIKDELARIVSPGGLAISFGWSTVGLSNSRGFVLEGVLLVCHGGIHHDTLVTIERKVV